MIIKLYRNHFGRLWRVMLPCVLILLAITIALILYVDRTMPPDETWGFDTVNGISLKKTSKPESGNWGITANFRFTYVTTVEKTIDNTTVDDVTWGWVLYVSWLSFGPLWIAMCPLTLVLVAHQRNGYITAREAWRQTFQKIWTLLGAYLLLLLCITIGIVILVVLLSVLGSVLNLTTSLMLMTLLSTPITYFMVSWSLHNQCIILGNLSAFSAFRRSRELLRGKWLKTFAMYALLTWGAHRIVAISFGLIGMLLSGTAPEFGHLGEELASEKFFTLFVGGYAGITLGDSVGLWAVFLMETVKVLINIFFLPIWAIFTTHLYFQRVDGIEEAR